MGAILGGAKIPPVPAPIAPPTVADPAIKQAAERQRTAAALARGRGSTILTSELGVLGGTNQRPRTLGGGM